VEHGQVGQGRLDVANELSHALFAAAIMALVNPLLGEPVVSWNLFLAGIAAMLPNLDRSDLPPSKGSPFGHSLGFALLFVYLGAVACYLGCLFLGVGVGTWILVIAAVTVALLTHMLLDWACGDVIYFLPRNARPSTWLKRVAEDQERFWPAWGRLPKAGWKIKDSHVNVLSLVILLLAIAFF
jgi:hypothetical protein